KNISENAARVKRKPCSYVNGGTTSVSSQKILGTGRSLSLHRSRRRRLFARDVAFSDRHFLFQSNFVFRFGNSHQPMVEPANNVLEPFDPVPRLSRTRKLVRFVRESHHHCGNFEKL